MSSCWSLSSSRRLLHGIDNGSLNPSGEGQGNGATTLMFAEYEERLHRSDALRIRHDNSVRAERSTHTRGGVMYLQYKCFRFMH